MCDGDGIARVITAIRDNAASRSSLYRYLWKHRRKLARAMGERRVDWQGMATALANLELNDAAGRSASAESVRRTWARVKKDDVAARGRADRKQFRAKPTSPAMSGEVAPGVRLPATKLVAEAHIRPFPVGEEDEPRLVLEPAGPRRSTGVPNIKSTPVVAAPSPVDLQNVGLGTAEPSASVSELAEEKLSRFRGELQAEQPQMPRVARTRTAVK